MYMVFADTPVDNLNVITITHLSHQVSYSLSHGTAQNFITIFRYPYEVYS